MIIGSVKLKKMLITDVSAVFISNIVASLNYCRVSSGANLNPEPHA